MKKIMPILAIIMIVPFVLCSCFTKQAESMSLGYEELELHVGDTKHISVTIKPDGADAGTINWSTSDSKIVTVDDGTVTGKAKGTAVVTAESESGLKRVCNVTVLDKEIESVAMSESSTSVKKGSKIQLEAKVKPVDAPSNNIVWSSSAPETASVDSNGMVLGEKEGVAIITCETENGKTATCTDTVKDTEKKATVPATEAPTQAVKQESQSRYPAARYYNYDDDFILPDSSIRKLSANEVMGLGSDLAQDAINEIYARHGYVFKTDSIRHYYQSQSWYRENYNFSESDLTSIETYNIALIKKYN